MYIVPYAYGIYNLDGMAIWYEKQILYGLTVWNLQVLHAGKVLLLFYMVVVILYNGLHEIPYEVSHSLLNYLYHVLKG